MSDISECDAKKISAARARVPELAPFTDAHVLAALKLVEELENAKEALYWDLRCLEIILLRSSARAFAYNAPIAYHERKADEYEVEAQPARMAAAQGKPGYSQVAKSWTELITLHEKLAAELRVEQEQVGKDAESAQALRITHHTGAIELLAFAVDNNPIAMLL